MRTLKTNMEFGRQGSLRKRRGQHSRDAGGGACYSKVTGPCHVMKGTRGGRGAAWRPWGPGLGVRPAPQAGFLVNQRNTYQEDCGPFHLAALSSSCTPAAGKPFHILMW